MTDIPADSRRYPVGCPDPDWCRGNRLCYWDCTADPDEIIEQVAVSGRIRTHVPGFGDRSFGPG